MTRSGFRLLLAILGLVAAAISFGSGLVLLIVLSVALREGRRGFATLLKGVRSRDIPGWMLAGGAAGALTVATQGLAVGLIGVSLFTVGVVAGQTNAQGTWVTGQEHDVGHLFHTWFKALGVDPKEQSYDNGGQPLPVAHEECEAVKEILA